MQLAYSNIPWRYLKLVCLLEIPDIIYAVNNLYLYRFWLPAFKHIALTDIRHTMELEMIGE